MTRAACDSSLMRVLVIPLLCALVSAPLVGQTSSPDSSAPAKTREQNGWVSLGVGVSQLGSGATAVTLGGWYANNKLVVGVHAADCEVIVTGPVEHSASLVVGLRSNSKYFLTLLAAGPSILGGWHESPPPSLGSTRVDEPTEIGIGASAQGIAHLPLIGLGVEGFAAGSRHHSLVGATLSVQIGWFGQ